VPIDDEEPTRSAVSTGLLVGGILVLLVLIATAAWILRRRPR
jgi:flagellar biogenesis protein FliO